MTMPPLHLQPILKRIRWGGTRLGTVLQKQINDWSDAAESWEVVDHGDDQSIVIGGPEAGRTLAELARERPDDLFGAGRAAAQFPLLIKFLDATDRLSLQVHPNDAQAKTFDPVENGKTEAWVILDTTPDSRIWLGLNPGVGPDDMRRAIAEERLEETVHVSIPQPGDCYFVPAGTVHAIGEGILLAEVQQSSDLTFRLHDWGRLGTDGQPRPIHIKESLQCIDFERGPLDAVTPRVLEDGPHRVEELVRCPYFGIIRHTAETPSQLQTGGRFRIVMVLDGEVGYTAGKAAQTLRKGTTILIPASCPELTLTPAGRAVWLEIDGPAD